MERREWINKFELINNRKPTVSEMEEAEWAGEFETVTENKINDELVESKIPSFKDNILFWIGHFFNILFKLLLFIIFSPFYIVLFFFDFIKSLLFCWFIWFISRPLFVGLAEGLATLFSKEPTNTAFYKGISNFFLGPEGLHGLSYSPTREMDLIVILIFSVILAIGLSYSRFRVNYVIVET